MSKPHVLFLFGNHGSMADRSNPLFFKTHAANFFRSKSPSCEPIIVLHENSPAFAQDPEYLAQVVRTGSVQDLSKLLHSLRSSRSVNEASFRQLDYGHPLVRSDEFGFESDILAINKRAPSRIQNVIEPWPVTPEALRLCLHSGYLLSTGRRIFSSSDLDQEREFLYVLTEECLARDRAVLKAVQELIQKFPSSNILIPRGRFHVAMRQIIGQYLDPRAIEIQLLSDTPPLTVCPRTYTQILDAALSDRYAGKLTEGLLMKYSQLALNCEL